MGRRAAFHTLGCKVNAYETEAMEELLQTAGYDIVPFTEQADVYVVNTCSVTNMAERKSRQMLHRAKKLNPEAVVVATGCYVQVSEEEARADAAVDLVLGNNQKRQIVTALDAYFEGRTFDDVLADVEKEQYEELEVSTVLEHTRAFVKVQDGCNQFCSYCIIPYARGRVRSRRMENVIAEIKRLAEAGIQEVVLTGIHLSSYGREIDGESHLIELIEAIHPIDGISRIRLGSLEVAAEQTITRYGLSNSVRESIVQRRFMSLSSRISFNKIANVTGTKIFTTSFENAIMSVFKKKILELSINSSKFLAAEEE